MNGRSRCAVGLYVVILCAVISGVPKASAAEPWRADNTPGQFDYYQLTLSWAPQFCATNPNAPASECDPKRHYGLVVHGLWPQNEDGSWPQNCTAAQPVSGEIVREMLPVMPARGLIQHEWATHGTCSGLSTQDYFARIQELFKQIKVPTRFQQPKEEFAVDPRKMEQSFADANGAPRGTFKVSCKKGDLVELNVCFTRDFKYRACGKSSGRCNVPEVKVLPTP